MPKEKKKLRKNTRKQKYQNAKIKLEQILINAFTDNRENTKKTKRIET